MLCAQQEKQGVGGVVTSPLPRQERCARPRRGKNSPKSRWGNGGALYNGRRWPDGVSGRGQTGNLSQTLAAMAAVIIATLVASTTGVAIWLLDQRLLWCRTAFRAAVTTALTVVATWIAVVIFSALWLKVPGAYGPVQYWHNDPTADFMISVRVGALFLMIAGFALAALTLVTTVVWLLFTAEDKSLKRLFYTKAAHPDQWLF